MDVDVEHLRPHIAPLRDMRARHGIFGVTNNHEYYSGATPRVAKFERLGMRVLINEHEVIEHDGATLIAAGGHGLQRGQLRFGSGERPGPGPGRGAGRRGASHPPCAPAPQRSRLASTCSSRDTLTVTSSGSGACSCLCSSCSRQACTGWAGTVEADEDGRRVVTDRAAGSDGHTVPPAWPTGGCNADGCCHAGHGVAKTSWPTRSTGLIGVTVIALMRSPRNGRRLVLAFRCVYLTKAEHQPTELFSCGIPVECRVMGRRVDVTVQTLDRCRF